MGFILLRLTALALITATFNPTEYSLVKWMMGPNDGSVSLMVLAGLLLSIGYIIYLRATLRSIGGFGMMLVLAFVGTLLWVFYDFGVLKLDNAGLNVWLGLIALSQVLGVVLSWSHVRRTRSGQADMDDVDQ